MGVDTVGLAAYLAQVEAAAGIPAYNRFAHWPRGRALILLIVVAVLLIEAALVPITVGHDGIATPPPLGALLGDNAITSPRPRDDDLALYDAAIARIGKGENYYRFIVAEHRRAHYPIRPAVAVRLPTLAYLDAWAGPPGQIIAAIALMLGVLWAWWQRLAEEPGGERMRLMAVALLFTGAALGLNRSYFVLHELWAGMLIALSVGLHRPAEPTRDDVRPGVDAQVRGKWLAAWCAAALALAIREHSLPFVLLMAGYAAWRRAWVEAQAWADLAILFLLGLALHIHAIAHQALPSDPVGPSWLAWRGLGGWLSDITLSSNLRFLPHWAAGPIIVFMILGWAGWRSHAGSFATLLYLGYGAMFMIVGRDDNFYWGAIIAPAMFIGLAFAPMSLRSLFAAALNTVEAVYPGRMALQTTVHTKGDPLACSSQNYSMEKCVNDCLQA